MRKPATSRLFDHGVPEHLSRSHPFMPALVWIPILGWLLWRSFVRHHLDGGVAGALAILGLLVWSFTEYAVHRFLFHLAPSAPWRRRVQFIVHGVHHEHPDDPLRLLMPPVPAGILACILYGLFRLALGPVWVDAFFASFLAGYLVYDYTHLYLHLGRPRTRVGRALRGYHMRHHFATPDARWGVTSPLWDLVFRTTGERSALRSRLPAAH